MAKIKVGVFDSGVGGLSVGRAIQKSVPEVEVIYRDDSEHVPYGIKPIDEIYGYTKPILQEMEREGCLLVIIACNTVTTNLIEVLRQDVSIPLIGMEPMIKLAANRTKTGVVAVCATRRTLMSPRYQQLKEGYAQAIRVLEPDCSDWILMIEGSSIDHQKISHLIEEVCNEGADQIVLGCTHFHWVEEQVKEAARGRAAVIHSEADVIKHLKRALARLS